LFRKGKRGLKSPMETGVRLKEEKRGERNETKMSQTPARQEGGSTAAGRRELYGLGTEGLTIMNDYEGGSKPRNEEN